MPGKKAGDTTYVGITGVSDNEAEGAMFTVMARNMQSGGHVISLLAGVPQNYISINQDDAAYFQVRLGSGHDELRVSLQPRSGKFIMYAKKCSGVTCETSPPGPSNYTTASICSESPTDVKMSRNDTEGSSYIVAVVPCGESASGGEYTITGSLESKVLTLSMGQSVTDYTKLGECAQFKVYNSEPGKDIFFMLTSLSGDSDLYISTSPNPTKEVHMWQQARYGSDAITIYPENNQYCSDCYYFITICGFEESYFSLLVSLKDDTPTILYPGMPQNDHVAESGVNHYAFQFIRTSSNPNAPSESITIELQPSYGDPDIFTIVSNGEGEGGNNGRGHPGPFNYDYNSMQNNQVADRVVIRTNTAKFNNLCPLDSSSCTIQIAITGFHESSYVLVVKTDVAITSLAIDTPFEGVLAMRSYEYFKVSIGNSDDTLRLTLTQTSGQR